MSKRTLRRAAERRTRQAEKLESLAVSPTPRPSLAPTDTSVAMNEEDKNNTHPQQDSAQSHPPEPTIPPATPKPTATPAQIAANQANAQLSTGPTTPEGKATVSQNRTSHGLTGSFQLLDNDDPGEFRRLARDIYAEHKPQTDPEQRLVDSIIQHLWLTQRAIKFQDRLLSKHFDSTEVDCQRLSLFLRYQTTHERSYYKALRELQNLQKQKRKDEIGFESQTRLQQAHDARTRLAHARATNLEVDAACRQVMEAPLPGTAPIPFAELTQACGHAIANLVFKRQHSAAA